MFKKVLFFFLISGLYANASELKDLEQELDTIKLRLEEHEKKISLTSKDTFFSIGGRVRMDMVYNDTSVGSSGGESAYDFYLTPNSISEHSDQKHELAMQARDSRLWFKTRKETPYGQIQTLVEVDFLGSSGNEQVTNSHNIRLRHAYVTLSNFTLGQTSSTFMGSGTSDSIQGSVDILLVRQPLIRYTKQFEKTSLELALESAETTLTTNTNALLVANDDQIPDLTARIKNQSKLGEISLSVLVRQLRIHDDDQNISAVSKNSFAYHLSGRLKSFGTDKITFGWAQGTGLGRYVAYNYFTSATLNDQNQLTLLPMTAYHIAYQHWWSTKLRSSLLYGWISRESDNNVVDQSSTKQADSYHANIRFSPFENALLTLEYIYAQKEDYAGNHYDLNRIYLSSSYDF